MQEATDATVLGDFNDARIDHFGVTSTFLRRDGAFVVHTDGPDGTLADYEIAYTFGVDPLQQYLVRFPDGRLRALGLAWDTRPASEGGQRWFHLHPDDAVPHGDVLHWTGPAGDWALQCGECHSTDLDTGYDAETDRYTPTWIDVDVGCEACHGPGSAHVAWTREQDASVAHYGLAVDFGKPGRWEFAPGARIAHREPPRTDHVEVETCAPCHARRAVIEPGTQPSTPFLDAHRPALLDAGLYFADGQMEDEVYVWGSFVQSRMYAAGVTCSDCHDPHSLTVGGDASCARCHRPEVFATPAHTHHQPGSAGASCIACHMPVRTYMVVDDRHDHSFRVPRPDLSVALGIPNACTDCHTDHDAEWAADTVASWYGDARRSAPHFAFTLDAGRRRMPGAAVRLAALAADASQPGIVRATALELLGEQLDPRTVEALRPAIADPDPLVRMAAAGASEALPAASRIGLVGPLLRDPVRAVRDEAARVLSDVPDEAWAGTPRDDFDGALRERLAGLRAQADRPDAHVALGVMHAQRGERASALREYEAARQLAPWFVPATVNLADLARADDRNDEAERVLREGLGVVPDSPDLHHALGLTLVRLGRTPEALEELGRAAGLAPENVRYTYVYAVALADTGHRRQALEELERAHQRFPGDVEVLVALVTMSRDAGRLDDARRHARMLAQVAPDLPGVGELVGSLGGATP